MCQLPPKTNLLNRYRVVRMIRSGCISQTYLAEDQCSGNKVVVKIANKTSANFADANSRIRREATFLRRLQGHPAFPGILAEGTVANARFLVMTFIDGPSLREVLTRRTAANSPLTCEELHSIACDLLEALAFVHQRRIWHRDLKPENVLLAEKGRAIIIDLGLGICPEDAELAPETFVGTPGYMCPESFRWNESVDHRTDLYALGMMLYELASGRHPFAECTDLSHLISAHLYVQPQPLSEIRQDLPRQFTDCVMRLLEKAPSARFPDARSAQRELQRTPPASVSRHARITPAYTEVLAGFRPTGAPKEKPWGQHLLDRPLAQRALQGRQMLSHSKRPMQATAMAGVTISFLVPLAWMPLRPALASVHRGAGRAA